jgi:tellurite resistance protein TerC
MIIKTIKQLKRLFIAIVGSTILLIGILLIVLPGPAFIIIPLGLSILASEFLWAKRLMDRLKEKLAKVFTKV